MKILVVDDEMFARRSFARIMTGKDVDLMMVDNSCDGYDMYCTERPDIVIADIMMAGLDGDWLITKILQNFPDANIIVCSGKPMEELLKYKLMGAKACIQKPVIYNKFWNIVDKIMEEQRKDEAL